MGIGGFLKLLQQLYINYDDKYIDIDNVNINQHQKIYIKNNINNSNKQIDIYIDFNSLIYILDDKKFLELIDKTSLSKFFASKDLPF